MDRSTIGVGGRIDGSTKTLRPAESEEKFLHQILHNVFVQGQPRQQDVQMPAACVQKGQEFFQVIAQRVSSEVYPIRLQVEALRTPQIQKKGGFVQRTT